MHPFLLGLVLPFAVACTVGLLIYSPPVFFVVLGITVIEEYARRAKARANEPPLPAPAPLPPVDVDAEALLAYRPPNGDVPPRPQASKPRLYVGPPTKLPKGGLLGAGE